MVASVGTTFVDSVEIPAGLAVELAVEILVIVVEFALVVVDISAPPASFEVMLSVEILVLVVEIALVLGLLAISEAPATRILVPGILVDLSLAS